MTPSRTRQSEQGVALALALIAALLLMIITFEVAHTTRVEQFISKNIEEDTKLNVACRAGLEVALSTLREDRQQTEIDSVYDQWFPLQIHSELIETDLGQDEFLYEEDEGYGGYDEEMQDTQLYIKIFDECAKYNVLMLLTDDPKKEQERKSGFANVLDRYRDDLTGDLSWSEGSEIADHVFQFLRRTADQPWGDAPKPPTKQSQSLTSLAELLYVGTITPSMMWDISENDGEDIVPGLWRFITIWTDMQINVNTGELPSLSGLFDSNDSFLAERIIEYRNEHDEDKERMAEDVSETGGFGPDAQTDDPTGGAPFTQVNEVQEKVEDIEQDAYNKISNFITVQSSVFSIFVTAKRGLNRQTKMWIVRRSEEGFQILFERPVDFPYFMNLDEKEQAEEEDAELYGRSDY